MTKATVKATSVFQVLKLIKTPSYKLKVNGEIRTDPALVDEILAGIPENVWKTCQRVLDPCCGRGTILLKMIDKLLDHHTAEEVSKMIYAVDIDKHCVYTTREIVAKRLNVTVDGLVNNIIQHDCLSWEPNMKFDAVVGNPPYQNPGKTKGQKLWYRIAKKSSELVKDGGDLILLTPNSWMSGGQNSADGWGLFRDLFTKYQVESTKITGITNTYFKAAGMKLGIDISWFHLKKVPIHKTTKIIAEDGELNIDFRTVEFLSAEPTIISNSIVSKTLGNKNLKKYQVVYHDNQARLGVLDEKKHPSSTHIHKHYLMGSTITNNLEISYLPHKHKKAVDFKKIIFPLGSRFWQPHLDFESMNSLAQGYAVRIDENTTEEGFKSVWYSKLFTYLMKNLQIDRNGTMKRSYVDSIPKVDLSREWTDEELYDLFDLTPEEREYINARTK